RRAPSKAAEARGEIIRMQIYTKVSLSWNGAQYVVTESEGYEYDGPVSLCCGATSEQKSIQQQQSDLFSTLKQQSQLEFGNASKVFQDLYDTFSPIVAAGPNQQGFSAPEKAALQSSAITNTGVATRNALQAAKEASAAVGGGNMALPSGADIGRNLSVVNAGANETAKELSDINEKNYEVGRENYLKA